MECDKRRDFLIPRVKFRGQAIVGIDAHTNRAGAGNQITAARRRAARRIAKEGGRKQVIRETKLRLSRLTLHGRVRSRCSLAGDCRCGMHNWSVSVDVVAEGWVGRHCERHLEIRRCLRTNVRGHTQSPLGVHGQWAASWEP